MDSPESDKKDVRRPMNAFLIFCKRHRAIVREKHPDLDNRSVTKILGDLWANLREDDKSVYTKLAKQYKDAFMKANPDYKWYNPEKVLQPPTKMTTRPTNIRILNGAPEISLDGKIMPGKLADPSNMGGLNLLLMAGQHFMSSKSSSCTTPEKEKRVTSPDQQSPKSALLELAEMCANELQLDGDECYPEMVTKKPKSKTVRCKIEKPADCFPINQPNVDTPRHGDNIDANEVTRKPKSKPTKWKMKKSLESASTSQLQFDKSEVVDSSEPKKMISQNSKRIRRKSEPYISEFVHRKTNAERETQFKSIKHDIEKMKEITFGGVFIQEGDNSVFDDKKLKYKRFRRTSNGETLAECLSDQNDNPIILDSGSGLMVSMDTKKMSGQSVGEVKFEAKVKKKVCEIEIKEEVKREETDVGGISTSCGTSVEDVGLTEKTAVMVPEFMKIEKKVEVCNKHVTESDGRHLEKKQSAPPEIEDVHVKDEKPDPDFNTVNEEDQDLQPIRKSRRRNRGQRYQELIDEGIIQPSKERLAARRAEKSTGCCVGENLLVCDESFYDEEIVEMRLPAKRSASETEMTDERKYKTGDFDLEAHIAVLPACSLEQCPKGRKIAKVRHNSEGSPRKPLSSDLAQTLILPPHVKVKSPEQLGQPLTGSRKRKARKHSITHLLSTKCATNQTTSLDPVKITENSEETNLPITRDAAEATEKTENAEDRTTQSTTIKREPPDSKISLCPDSDAQSEKSNDAQVMQERRVANVADKKRLPGIDEKNNDDSLHDCNNKRDRYVFEKDGREAILEIKQNCEKSLNSEQCFKTEYVNADASSTTAETEFTPSYRSESCLPIVLSRTEIKSEIVPVPTARVDHVSLQDLCQSVVTSRGLKVKVDGTCISEPAVTVQHVNTENATEKYNLVLSDGTETQSFLANKNISSREKEIVECGVNPKKLVDESECVEMSVVTMATDEQEDRLDESSSTITKTAQTSVTMVTDEQNENHAMVESSTSSDDNVVAIVTSSATIVVSEVATVSSVTTTAVNPILYSTAKVMVSTSATIVSPVSMVSTSASNATSPVSTVSTSPSTVMSPVSMVSTSASNAMSPVSMVSTSASTVMNPVAMVSSPVTAVASPVSAVSSPVTAVCS